MNKIKLNNGVELDVVLTCGQSRYFQSANRDSLEFHFEKDSVTFDFLDNLFKDDKNTSRIIITDNTGSYLHENYVLRVSIAFTKFVITPETSAAAEVTEERYVVTMAQKSYAEIQKESFQDTLDTLVLESLGV